MPKRVLIAAGGTGGHLFPAQILAKNLVAEMKDVEIHFAGKGLSTNKRFHQEFPFTDIPAATLQKSPLTWLKTGRELVSGIAKAMSLLRSFKPDLLVGFGSYHTASVTAAAALMGVPYVLFESNSTPGRVIRLFSGRARWTGLYFPDAETELKGECRLTKMPLKKEFLAPTQPTRVQAARYFGLDPEKKTLLIVGGSQGAKSINQLLLDAYPAIQTENLQYLHFTGDPTFASPYKEASVKPFEAHMEFAYALADFAICRAGAVTIAELQAFNLPALFIPYPHAADNHQEKNARYVENSLGNGFLMRESECTGKRLAHAIDSYFTQGLDCALNPHEGRQDLHTMIIQELQQ